MANDDAGRGDRPESDELAPTILSRTHPSPASDNLTRIGAYRILSTLGEGGMGVVYKVEQDHPRRTVALKVIKPGFLNAELLHRFDREAEVLGRLHHPGIAQIYDAGTADTPSGTQPYFAMEYVGEAQDLTAHAEAAGLTTNQRLDLMARVCDAVEHAHQRGVIHRDLKPANILVDEAGQPKVLDFGIARATDSDVQATMGTDLGQLVGTLPYMSPEQVGADPLDLDTRSDVYALGVILFELLAGHRPYPIGRTLTDAARTITEEEPPKLGTLNRAWRGDVETIAAKSLEKDPSRRYQSAADLAADLRRHLGDEPLLARPATLVYQLQKFARRRPGLVGGAVATALALLLGLIGTGYGLVEARLERDQATAARDRATQETAKSVAVNAFLLETMGSANPFEGMQREVSVLDVLHVATETIDESFADQPEIRAAVQHTIGSTYRDLGELDLAEPLLSSALAIRRGLFADPHPDVLESLIALGELFHYKRDADAATAQWVEALGLGRSLFGETHADVAEVLNNLGIMSRVSGDYEAAEAMLQEALEIQRTVLGDVHEQVANTWGNLATVHLAQGDFAAAEPLLRNALDIARTALGPDSVQVGRFLQDLGGTLVQLQRHAEAEGLLLRSRALLQTELGDAHQETVQAATLLVLLYEGWGKPDQAAEYRALLAGPRPTP